MNKFTKSMAAIAVSALVAGPAAAVTYDGSKASVKLSGSGKCKSAKEKNLDMVIDMDVFSFILDPNDLDFDSGPNTGVWESELFSFGDNLDGEGVFIISKVGKTSSDAPKKATMDVSEGTFEDMIGLVDGYLVSECENVQELFASSCQITKNEAKFSKSGEQLTVKMDMKCTYEDTKEKDRNVTLKLNSGKLVD